MAPMKLLREQSSAGYSTWLPGGKVPHNINVKQDGAVKSKHSTKSIPEKMKVTNK